jgi:ribulose-phosphate 3-epimerase
MAEQRILISPSILASDFTRLGEEVETVVAAGADMIHIDVMDGHFVPNITLGPVIVRAVRSVTDVPIDAHLMITDPAKYAPAFIDAGADYIMFHSEVVEDAHEVIDLIRKRGAKPGLAVNPPNPPTHIEPYLDAIDLALIMTVNPGFAGQSFISDVMPKLSVIAEWKRRRELDFLIEVDGGVGPETAPEVARNGGEVLVAASAIFKQDDRGAALKAIRQAALNALV